ncbi:MAG: hypothetical protein AAFM92_08810 [Pseudomonadota bacterium]
MEALAFRAQPKDFMGFYRLGVAEHDFSDVLPDGRTGPLRYYALVVLPNGKLARMETEPRVVVDNEVCAEMFYGRWFASYHVTIHDPRHCS